MRLLQFAVPEKVGAVVAEAATVIAGGATLVPAMGWWINEAGTVEREKISWLVVGVEEEEVEKLVDTVKEILKNSGEKAVFYTIGVEPKLEWL